MKPTTVNLTPARRAVLTRLAQGDILYHQAAMFGQKEHYRWIHGGPHVLASTVGPLIRAGLIGQHPVEYRRRTITYRGRQVLTEASRAKVD